MGTVPYGPLHVSISGKGHVYMCVCVCARVCVRDVTTPGTHGSVENTDLGGQVSGLNLDFSTDGCET